MPSDQTDDRGTLPREGCASLPRAAGFLTASSTRGCHRRFRRPVLSLLTALLLVSFSWAQAHFETGTGLGVEKVRLAVAGFQDHELRPQQPRPLQQVFNEYLWNDLDNAGIFDMVSKSFYPLADVGLAARA